MASPMLPVDGIDMNDEVNLALYTQLVVFKTNREEVETLFEDPSPVQQRAIQTWAHSFGCDYEYTLATRTTRVVKAVDISANTTAEFGDLDFLDFNSYPDSGVAENGLGGTNDDLEMPDVSLLDNSALWSGPNFWLNTQASLDTGYNSIETSQLDALAEIPLAKHMAPNTPQESMSDPKLKDQNKNARPVSPGSPHTGRSRKLLNRLNGRRQSVHSQASSGYQEIVFNSGSSRPNSPGTPGRRDPLDAAARAAMKAVKDVQACWRCKFLRKHCSPDNPCLRCPTRSNAKEKSWPAVGCNRGLFKEVLAPLHLCPAHDFEDATIRESLVGLIHDTKASANKEYQSRLNTRAEVLRKAVDESVESQPTTLVSYIQSLEPEIMERKFEGFQIASLLPVPLPMRGVFAPLEECIAAVVYEAIHCDLNTLDLDEYRHCPRMMHLLYSAARYQAKNDADELIAQSIICLRASFEAIRMTNDPYYGLISNTHDVCKSDNCQNDCIRSLEEHLTLYLDALSKVFFKKKNMRVKETWWLSTFYSFAIQGLVRKLLQQLSYILASGMAANQYLHLAIRLFIASSGDYDPLIRDYVALSKGKEADPQYISDLEEVKIAVEQSSWASRDIFSSADYLRNLFEDDTGNITVKSDVAEKPEAAPETLISYGTQIPFALPSEGSKKEETCNTWSSSNKYPAYSGKRPYRPSSLSSMESSSEMGLSLPHTANTMNSHVIGDIFPQMSFHAPSVRSDGSSRSNSPIALYTPVHQDLQEFDDYSYHNGEELSGIHPMFQRDLKANDTPIHVPVSMESLVFNPSAAHFLDSQRSSPKLVTDPWELPPPPMITSTSNSLMEHSPSLGGISPCSIQDLADLVDRQTQDPLHYQQQPSVSLRESDHIAPENLQECSERATPLEGEDK